MYVCFFFPRISLFLRNYTSINQFVAQTTYISLLHILISIFERSFTNKDWSTSPVLHLRFFIRQSDWRLSVLLCTARFLSFFYRLFESLTVLPRLWQTFSSAFFCVVSPDSVPSYTRARTRWHGPVYSRANFFLVSRIIRQFFVKFLRLGIKSLQRKRDAWFAHRNDSRNYRGRYLGCAPSCIQNLRPKYDSL